MICSHDETAFWQRQLRVDESLIWACSAHEKDMGFYARDRLPFYLFIIWICGLTYFGTYPLSVMCHVGRCGGFRNLMMVLVILAAILLLKHICWLLLYLVAPITRLYALTDQRVLYVGRSLLLPFVRAGSARFVDLAKCEVTESQTSPLTPIFTNGFKAIVFAGLASNSYDSLMASLRKMGKLP